jgi:hypothetical protein
MLIPWSVRSSNQTQEQTLNIRQRSPRVTIYHRPHSGSVATSQYIVYDSIRKLRRVLARRANDMILAGPHTDTKWIEWYRCSPQRQESMTFTARDCSGSRGGDVARDQTASRLAGKAEKFHCTVRAGPREGMSSIVGLVRITGVWDTLREAAAVPVKSRVRNEDNLSCLLAGKSGQIIDLASARFDAELSSRSRCAVLHQGRM